jgi:hypothetical protein
VAGSGVDGGLVTLPGHGGSAVLDADGDAQQWRHVGADDAVHPGLNLLRRLVVPAAESTADTSEFGLGLGQGAFAGLGDRPGFLG